MRYRFLLLWFLASICSVSFGHDSKKIYDIKEIKPNIYRTQQGPYYGIVLEGKNSLLVFDTFNEHFSQWLDTELQKRFPNKPVQYVVYSHNHPDHVSGGHVFAHHNPTYISHTLAKESMQRMAVPTRYASITFDHALHIDFDGMEVELSYWGENDGWGSISMFIPSRKFIAAVDWVLIDRVSYMHSKRYNIDGMIRSLYAIDKLDWDLISPGHASTGTKEAMRNFRNYLETIRSGVIKGINAQRDEEEIIKDVMAELRNHENFTSLKMFDEWAAMNVRGVYKQIAEVEGILE